MTDEPLAQELVREISSALSRRGFQSEEASAREWIAAGFEDAEEVEAWLEAGCFNPQDAEMMEAAGITPEQAAIRTRAGSADYEETIAHKIANKDLTLEEARRIITSAFWQ